MFLIVSGLAVVVIVCHFLGALNPAERVLLRGMAWMGRSSLVLVDSMVSGNGVLGSRSTSQVTELQQRINDLTAENAQLYSQLQAVQESNEQRSFLASQHFEGIQARVFARSADPTTVYIVADRGSRDGIRAGQPAFIRNGIIIGVVISTTDETSRILLTVDNRSSIAGLNLKNPSAQGIITGIQGLSLSMDLIPQSEEVSIHDTIITSGLDPEIPRGLVIGEIERLNVQHGALFQSAVIQVPYTSTDVDAITILATHAE